MRFREADLLGTFVIELELHLDERGFFTRIFAEEEFAAHGLPIRYPHLNLSRNTLAGTLRGIHYNAAPWREAKIVRCTVGAVWDVIVDLRADSPTRLRWVGMELTARGGQALFVPEGFGHGFVTLVDDSDVMYHMSRAHVAGAARGVRWSDPRIAIAWPRVPTTMSQQDGAWPEFDEATFDG